MGRLRYKPDMLPAPDDTWSTRALFECALVEAKSDVVNEEAYWRPIYLLHKRDVTEVWGLVAPHANHSDANVRALVPDVLRYLGGPVMPRRADTVTLFREMLRLPQPPNVIAAIASAFVDLRDPAALEVLAPFITHPDGEVRRCIVHALLPIADRAVPELIALSRDADPEVRNWATFGLGSQLGEPGEQGFVDNHELREALAARLNDQHDEVRAEAALGLAIRNDPRALPIVRRELEAESDWLQYIDAAAALADESLCAALRDIAARAPDTPGLDAALAACCPKS